MRTVFAFVSAVLMLCPMTFGLPMCSGETPSADWSLLTGEPCEPPCWQGLTPGQSTEHETAAFLESSDYAEGSSLWQDRTGCGEITYWRSPIAYARNQPISGWTSNYLCASNGTLKAVMVYLVYDLTLEQLLDRYGPPEAFRAHSAGVPERPYVEVNLYYPGHGFMCQLELPIDCVQLHSETEVVRAWYFPPTSLEALVDPRDGVPFPPREYMRDVLQDWQGYGPIEVR